MPPPRSHYDILNVAHDAEPVVIEAAYRALMKKYHPDQGTPAVEGAPSAARINDAFSILRDADRRSEYDHNEWVRAQNIQLAQYPPPPPRQSNFFGWGGWLIALLLAGTIALIAGRSGGLPPLSNSEEARAAAAAQPDYRSQPRLPKEDAVTPAQAAEIQAEALGLPAAPVPNRADPLPTRVDPLPSGTEPAEARARPSPPRIRSAWAARQHMRRHPARGEQRGKDFLERQGGIY
jgi:curved DNA-binding protein CbpA